MSPRVEALHSNDALPARADVVIVGGGIVGVCAALALRKRGLSVAVLEKGVIAGEQSSRNWGWCREQLRSLPEVPLAMKSMALWRNMSDAIGEDSGFRQTGMMVVTKDPSEVARWEGWLQSTKAYGMEGGLLSAAETRAALPATSERWISAIHSPVDGWAEPAIAAPAIARSAQRQGATIHQQCAVRGWETSAGRLSHVVTERGEIRTQAVLCAAGAWSTMLLRRHGIDFPQSGVYATAFRTTAAAQIHPGGVGSPKFSYRRRIDGGYTIGLRGRGRIELTPMGLRQARHFASLFIRRRGELTIRIGKSFLSGPGAWSSWQLDRPSPFEQHRIYDPSPDPRLIEAGLAAFHAAYPSMAHTRVAESWGGLIDATPDMVPVISPAGGVPGCYLASGFSGHGFAIGPGAGFLAAEMIAGEVPSVDPTPFRLERFFDGTQHRIHQWV
ncbi:NAD(P)/FAD-dependent oxidoreductase [Halotalea alkalilenta]|uniref:D-amino-acid oxidase n=1 Tax=Halotalea alkalilenta TaxID=376489 RepID=A0A172YGL9_9GAMM|nr:FAD-binding oxidoreductase [Halotalea alkalilenta]ANF58192.1 D-amino-acid oxidase [Halotalea alkalilenta]